MKILFEVKYKTSSTLPIMWVVSFSYNLATVVQLHTQTVMHQVTVKGLLITGVQPCFDKTTPPHKQYREE